MQAFLPCRKASADLPHHLHTGTAFMALDTIGDGVVDKGAYMQLSGLFTPDSDGDYEFGLACCGQGMLFLDSELLIDNWHNQTAGE